MLFPTDGSKIGFITFVPSVAGTLSFFGSLATMLTIYRTAKAGTKMTTYHRILFGLSICDMIQSFALALGPLPVPPDAGMTESYGNITTCTMQGFLLHLGTGSFVYSNMLMCYYILVIRYNIRESVIATKYEPYMHAIPILFHSITGILGLIWKVFNQQGALCWIGVYPPGCDEDPEIECTRGEDKVNLFGIFLLILPFVFWNLMVIACLIVLACTVWCKYRSARRFIFEGSEGSSALEEKTSQVLVQCFLYGFAFLNVLIWGLLETILILAGVEYDDLGRHFWISALGQFCFPIQGFFNFLIFLRPRYMDLRSKYPNESRWFAFREAIWYPVDTTTQRNVRGSKVSSAMPPRELPTPRFGGLPKDSSNDSCSSRMSAHFVKEDEAFSGRGDATETEENSPQRNDRSKSVAKNPSSTLLSTDGE